MLKLWERMYISLVILWITCKFAYAGPSPTNRSVSTGSKTHRVGQSRIGPPSGNGEKRISMRVMSFNTYFAGRAVDKGMQKIAKHIKLVNPDIVGLQEINQADTDSLVQLLGKGWTHCSIQQTRWLGASIVTKHTIVEKYAPADDFSNIGCRIELTNGQRVNVWNVHLNYRNYGPYTTCVQPKGDTLKKLHDQEHQSPDAGATLSRVTSVVRLLNHAPMLTNRINAGKEPIVLTGDFNVPSGLDWTSATKTRHCGIVFDWPVAKILADNGFVDSYRKVYPNPSTNPGATWSPVNYYYLYDKTYLEPQDRIDFIYYKGTRISATSSRTYVGSKPVYYVPNINKNDWPSDHASVVTDFEIGGQ